MSEETKKKHKPFISFDLSLPSSPSHISISLSTALTHVPTCGVRVILQRRLFVLLEEVHEAFLPVDERRHLMRRCVSSCGLAAGDEGVLYSR